MKVELVEVVTDDQLVHAGALLEAASPVNQVPGVDAVLMMHGNSLNFYHPFFRYFAEQLAAIGCATLRANNRGHDVIHRPVGVRDNVSALESFHVEPAAYFGTACEAFDDCRRDWRAWLTFLWDRGYRRLLLWGHSRGAVKTAYYLAIEHDPRVQACILASPPHFSYARWMQSPQADLFAADLAEAQWLVDLGQPDGLVHVQVPMDYLTTAGAYLDQYGPAEKYNVMWLIGAIRCPVLAISGTEEVAKRFGFDGLPAGFSQIRQAKPDLTHLSVPGGDHFYTGKQEYVLERVLEWLASLSPAGNALAASPSSRP